MLFFWMMSILLNTVICYDLVFILYNPFTSPKVNVVVSLAISICISVAVATQGQWDLANNGYIIVTLYETMAYFVFFIFAVTSVVYAWCRMRGTLFSGEVKSLILKRHIAYIVAYLMLNLFLLFVATLNIVMHIRGSSRDANYITVQCDKIYARVLLWLFVS